jgi:hypothetical protein
VRAAQLYAEGKELQEAGDAAGALRLAALAVRMDPAVHKSPKPKPRYENGGPAQRVRALVRGAAAEALRRTVAGRRRDRHRRTCSVCRRSRRRRRARERLRSAWLSTALSTCRRAAVWRKASSLCARGREMMNEGDERPCCASFARPDRHPAVS